MAKRNREEELALAERLRHEIVKQQSSWNEAHFRANVGAASRALNRASSALASDDSKWRSQAAQAVGNLIDAAYYLGRAETHNLMHDADPAVETRFEQLFSTRREWSKDFHEWLKGVP